MRAVCLRWVENSAFNKTIFALIFLNAIILGFETSPGIMAQYGHALKLADKFIIAIFVLELGARLIAYGAKFFRSGWNIFDFIIVAITFVPAQEQISVLRAFRILRAFRLLSAVPKMRRVVEALLDSIPGLISIAGLLALIFYVFAVLATNLFGAQFPDLFGNIGRSMYTLFQIMTLEGWSAEVVRPIMEIHKWAWVFFIPFILISAFTVLNLFLALIVDSLQSIKESQSKEILSKIDEMKPLDVRELTAEIQKMEQQLSRINAILNAPQNHTRKTSIAD
jgi:voltage-gated sodium channel